MSNFKKISLTLLISIILIIISCFSINNIMKVFADEKPKNDNINSQYEYILKSYNGKLGVYDAKNNSLEKVYNVYVNTLPEYDIKELEKGIKIKDKTELNSYLEEFDS